MANELPPLKGQSDSTSIPNDVLNQLQHASQWAGTFGGSDTNLVQRYRHNQDITDYAGALEQKRAEAQQSMIQTNKVAQDLYLGSLRLDQQQRESNLRMQHANEMAPLNMAAKTAQIQAEQARAVASAHADILKAKHEKLEADDTLGLSQHMNEIMDRAKPGTEDYNAGVTRGVLEFPYANKAVQSALLKNAGIQMTPEEFIAAGMKAKQDAAAAGYSDPRISSFQGKPVVIEGAAPKLQDPHTRLTHLESLRMKPGVDDDVKAYLDSEIASVTSSIGGTASTPSNPNAPTAPASFDTPEDFSVAAKNAKSGEVIHYKGKAYKKP